MSGQRSLLAQIQEVERELDQRNRVYPGLIRQARMRQGQADEHIHRMTCVLKTLNWLHANETAIRAAAKQEA